MQTAETMTDIEYRGGNFEPEHLAELTDCTPLLNDPAALREQVDTKGYIFLRGILGRERVKLARRSLINCLQKADALDPDFDPMDGVLKLPFNARHFIGGALHNEFPDPDWRAIHDVLYEGPMMEVALKLLGGPVRHYDYTWCRLVGPGPATQLHSDVVYMGRGTHNLFTAWTPMGDNGFDTGGLLILEGSNQFDGLKKTYWKSDVDSFCVNKPESTKWGKSWGTTGGFDAKPAQLRKSLRCDRWLTADYKMGDVVLFNCYTVHGGSDNRSNKVRLSTDTRYQLASDPIDERWVGSRPVGHGPAGKRGKIC